MDKFPHSRRNAGIAIGDIASASGCHLRNEADAGRMVHGVAPLSRAGEGDLTFSTSRRAVGLLAGAQATAIICTADLASAIAPGVAVLVSSMPQTSFAKAAALLHPDALRPLPLSGQAGISSLAVVHPDAMVEDDVTIEAHAVIGAGAEIGSGTVISAGAVVGAGCAIGRNCSIGPHVSVQCALIGNEVILHPGARIGQDGFGYAPSSTGLQKIVQIGRVILQDRVEVGANTAIDRGAMDDTVIGEGTKIDNLVQIGHNVRIGRHSVIVALVAIAGSVNIGDQVMIGGGTTIAGHLTIGSGAQIAGMSAVASDVPAAARWGGIPARPMRAFLRDMAEINARAFKRGKTGDKSDD